MAVVACASRYAVLKLEDDDICENVVKKPTTTPAPNNTQSGKNKSNTKAGSNELKSKSKKKKKANNEIAELQNLAFASHSSKSKQKSSSNHGKAVNPSQKQWEEWKAKDSEFVSETYEHDLQEAILLSKIDYEEKKEIYDAISKEAEHCKLSSLSKKKKKNNSKREKGTMSLDEFQNLGSAEIDSGNFQRGNADLDEFEIPPKTVAVDDSNFFEKIEADAEKIITKEQRQEQYKAHDNAPIIDSARLAQCLEESKEKDKKITALKEMVLKLKEELKNVKTRNRKLYGILETGEMREKAEILVQVDQLTEVKDELTEQVNEYHTALEQERSKVHSLQMELKKYQNNRKQRTESK